MRPATKPHVQRVVAVVRSSTPVSRVKMISVLPGAHFLGCPRALFREGGWGRASSVVTGLTSLFGTSMINKQVLVLCSDACETFRDASWHPCGGGLETILGV